MSGQGTWRRPPPSRRPTYEPALLQERYIVPLLAEWVEAKLRALAGHGGGGRALDVGCGSQPFRGLIEELGYRYSGLDVQASPGVDLDVVAAIDDPLPPEALRDGPFDLVLCLEVLEHVADWQSAWPNLARLTAPGGLLVVTSPFMYQLHDEPFDFWRTTPHNLQAFADDAGFDIVDVARLGDPWQVLGTTLASASPPVTSKSMAARGRRAGFRGARRAALWLIDVGLVQRLVPLEGPVYLSNVAIMRRCEGSV